MSAALSKFKFNFYRFTHIQGQRSTELVRDYTQADGMRGLVDRSTEHIQLATERALDWAQSKGLTANISEPFPSQKHPGKVWLEFRFGGLTL